MECIAAPPHTARLNCLQLLRGICCVSIIIAHCVAYGEMAFQVPIGTHDYPFRYSMLQCATLFLALSGFFLAGEIQRGDSGKTFLKKKFARIFPTYWLAIALAVLLRMAFQQTFAPHPHFWRIFFLIPLEAPYLLNGEWTLLCDMLYYLIGAVFIGHKRSRFFPAFLAAWGCVLLVGVWFLYPNLGAYFYLPQMLIAPVHLSFLAGCCAWYAHERFGSLLQQFSQVVLISVEVLVFCVFFCTNGGSHPVFSLVCRFVCYFLLLFIGAQIRISPTNPLVKVGDHSYGMYLSNWTIFSIVYPFLNKPGISWGVAYAAVLCCTLILSYQFGAIDLALGAAVRRKLLTTQIDIKKLLYPGIACLGAAGIVFVTAIIFPYAKLYAPRTEFDYDAILKAASGSCGYVDRVEVIPISEGVVQIHADGWGYDPVANQLVNDLIIVADGEVIPAAVSWYDRSTVGEVLKNPILTTCGWTLNTGQIRLKAPTDISFYVPLIDGNYMELSASPWQYEG